MFSIKKYALIGVAALTAFTISCSDDEKGEDGPDPWKPGAGENVLGGVNSSDYGSSLDIDKNTVYKIGQLSGVKNDIDIVFDGTNVWTPNSITKSTGIASLKDALAGSSSDAVIFNVPSTASTTEDLRQAFEDSPDEDIVINNTSKGKKFGVLTSEGDLLALVTIKDKNTETGSIYIELLTLKAD
jgi:hypothetical protein